jgi:hypothetical protein
VAKVKAWLKSLFQCPPPDNLIGGQGGFVTGAPVAIRNMLNGNLKRELELIHALHGGCWVDEKTYGLGSSPVNDGAYVSLRNQTGFYELSVGGGSPQDPSITREFTDPYWAR